jgi:DNA repair protein RAD16
VYDPNELSTPAYPGEDSDDSALSELSDGESDFSDSSAPTTKRSGGKGKAAARGKGKGKGKAGFAGQGRRLADGEEVSPSPKRLTDSHVGYCSRREGETDQQYDDRCYKKWQYDQGAEDREEFRRQERKLKKQVGRKLTNGEKNHIRLIKVSKILLTRI